MRRCVKNYSKKKTLAIYSLFDGIAYFDYSVFTCGREFFFNLECCRFNGVSTKGALNWANCSITGLQYCFIQMRYINSQQSTPVHSIRRYEFLLKMKKSCLPPCNFPFCTRATFPRIVMHIYLYRVSKLIIPAPAILLKYICNRADI